MTKKKNLRYHSLLCEYSILLVDGIQSDVSVTIMFFGKFPTLLASDLAAPQKLAVAVVYFFLYESLVTPPTAHELAAV